MPYSEEDKIIRNYRPLVMPETSSVALVAHHMRIRNASAVLAVAEDDEFVGIFTERDAINRVLADGRDPIQTILSQVMTYNPVRVAPTTTATEALQLMRSSGFRHLPVVEGSRVIGLISCGDFRKPEDGFDRNRSSASQAAAAPAVQNGS